MYTFNLVQRSALLSTISIIMWTLSGCTQGVNVNLDEQVEDDMITPVKPQTEPADEGMRITPPSSNSDNRSMATETEQNSVASEQSPSNGGTVAETNETMGTPTTSDAETVGGSTGTDTEEVNEPAGGSTPSNQSTEEECIPSTCGECDAGEAITPDVDQACPQVDCSLFDEYVQVDDAIEGISCVRQDVSSTPYCEDFGVCESDPMVICDAVEEVVVEGPFGEDGCRTLSGCSGEIPPEVTINVGSSCTVSGTGSAGICNDAGECVQSCEELFDYTFGGNNSRNEFCEEGTDNQGQAFCEFYVHKRNISQDPLNRFSRSDELSCAEFCNVMGARCLLGDGDEDNDCRRKNPNKQSGDCGKFHEDVVCRCGI